MIAQYSEAQVAEFKAFYEEHGVVKLPGLLPPSAAAELLRVVDETAARVDEPPTPTQGPFVRHRARPDDDSSPMA